MSDSELAHLKSIQLKDQLRMQSEAAAAVQAPAEEAAPAVVSHAADETMLAGLPKAPAPAPVGKTHSTVDDPSCQDCRCTSAVLHMFCLPYAQLAHHTVDYQPFKTFLPIMLCFRLYTYSNELCSYGAVAAMHVPCRSWVGQPSPPAAVFTMRS